MTLIQSLIPLTPPGSTHWGPWDIYDHLCHFDDVGYSPPIFAYVNYFSGVTARGDQPRLGVVPGFKDRGVGKPILGGVGLGIAHTCPHVPEATALGQFLMSDAVQQDIFPQNHGQPAALSAWRDEAINQHLHEFYRSLSFNMANAYIRPRYVEFHLIELRNGQILQHFLDGYLSLGKTLSQLCGE